MIFSPDSICSYFEQSLKIEKRRSFLIVRRNKMVQEIEECYDHFPGNALPDANKNLLLTPFRQRASTDGTIIFRGRKLQDPQHIQNLKYIHQLQQLRKLQQAQVQQSKIKQSSEEAHMQLQTSENQTQKCGELNDTAKLEQTQVLYPPPAVLPTFQRSDSLHEYQKSELTLHQLPPVEKYKELLKAQQLYPAQKLEPLKVVYQSQKSDPSNQPETSMGGYTNILVPIRVERRMSISMKGDRAEN